MLFDNLYPLLHVFILHKLSTVLSLFQVCVSQVATWAAFEHAVQLLAACVPDEFVVFPFAHAVHVPDPVDALYDPITHAVQLVAPAAANVPFPHAVHFAYIDVFAVNVVVLPLNIVPDEFIICVPPPPVSV